MGKYVSKEEINKRLEAKGIVMVSDEYMGVKQKHIFKCIDCGENFETTINSILLQNVCRCKKCSYIFSGNKRKKENLNLEEILSKLKEIGVKLKYEKGYGNTEKTIFICKTCGEEYFSNLYQVLHDNRHQCKKCTSKKWSNDEFLNKVKEVRGEGYIFMEEYKGSQKNIKVKHVECGYEYYVTPDAFLNQKQQCPKCQGKIELNLELAKEKLSKMAKCNDYEILDGNRNINNNYILKIKHLKCGTIFKSNYSSFINNDSNCPVCKGYKNEINISNILKTNNIIFESQYKFHDCRYKNPLPFDFAIFDKSGNLKFLIEYQGEHHYMPIKFGGVSDERAEIHFDMVKRNDKIKYEYCKNKNINLVLIPYTESKNIENIILKLI